MSITSGFRPPAIGKRCLHMKFGVSHGDSPASRSLEILRAAESAGFHQFWHFDSHILWQECYSKLGWLIAQSRSEGMEFGLAVTNPITRDPAVTASAFATLNEVTDGRMICGIGRGDSSVRITERKPANLAAVEEAIHIVRKLGSGQPMTIDGVDAQIEWAQGRVPVYVAGYGPKALRLAGRVGDGVIFQVADPFFIQWGMQHVRAGAEEAGRDPSEIVIHCATATYISDDRDEARECVRWFPALVGNHIADVIRHHDPEVLPDYIAEYVGARTDYDYRHHDEPGYEHGSYVPDEICDRFCVIGSVQECLAKVQELAEIGVSEFNIYPNVPDLEDVIATYGREIAPKLQTGEKVAGARAADATSSMDAS
jgi:probable F420-dependent oxidoreductase